MAKQVKKFVEIRLINASIVMGSRTYLRSEKNRFFGQILQLLFCENLRLKIPRKFGQNDQIFAASKIASR